MVLLLNTSSEEARARLVFKREGFWQGSDRNPEAVAHDESEPGIEGFAQYTFETSGDLLEKS